MSFKIYWLNKEKSTMGYSKKTFTDSGEAQRLCDDLNRDYPGIVHEVVPEDHRPESSQPQPEKPKRDFTELTDESTMPFGAHLGIPMGKVPSQYLDWLSGQFWLERDQPAVADYIRRNRKSIDQDLDID